MERIRYWVARAWNRLGKWIITAAIVIGGAALLISGFSAAAALLAVFLAGIIIYFGALKTLANSFVIGILLKAMSTDLKEFISIWFAGPTNDHFFIFVNQTGYCTMIAIVFAILYSLNVVTGSIRLFHFNSTVKVVRKKREPKKKEGEADGL